MLGAPGIRRGGFVPSTAARQRDRLAGSRRLRGRRSALRREGRNGLQRVAARALYQRLEPMRVASSPFAGRLSADEARQVRFVRPELVAEVDFRAWTADNVLRHASFKALREDKPAREVVRETAAAEAAQNARKAPQEAPTPAPHGRADPSRPRLLARRRRHQGRARRLLRGSLAAHGARSSSAGRSRCCAARTASRGSSSSRSTPGKGSIAASSLSKDPKNPGQPLDQRPRPRRPDRSRAGGDARNPSLGLDRRPTGSGRT